MEVRNIELKHLDFDRRLLHVVQSKGNKDRYVPLSEHLIRGIRRFIAVEQPVKYLFEGAGNPEGKGFDGRYSQKGVQWAVKTVARQAASSRMFIHTRCATPMPLIYLKMA